ncbi:MAG: hypothetical protein JXR97_10470, partial [Planctomycetes bacterium]|nr:hypothetical protein [Planctomycetota bacterium]
MKICAAKKNGFRVVLRILCMAFAAYMPVSSYSYIYGADSAALYFEGAAGEEAAVGAKLAEGFDFLGKGKLKEAGDSFGVVLKDNPKSGAANFALATLRLETGEYAAALDNYAVMLKSGYHGPWVEVALADILNILDDAKDLAPIAEALAERAGRADISLWERNLVRNALGEVYRHLGKNSEAMKLIVAEPFVREWQVVGPFENRDGSGFVELGAIETSLPKIDLNAEYAGRGRKVKWFKPKMPWHGNLEFSKIIYPAEESCAYAATVVDAKEETEASILCNTGGACAIWLNGQKIYSESDCFNQGAAQIVLPVKLRKGGNVILCKVGAERFAEFALRMKVVPLKAEELSLAGSAARADARNNLIAFKVGEKDFSDACGDADVDIEAAAPVKPVACGALGYFDDFLAKHPDDAFILGTKAYLIIVRGMDDYRFMRVRPLLERAVSLTPDSPILLEMLAVVQSDDNEKREMLERAVASSPIAVSARELRLDELQRSGFLRKAEEEARDLLKSINSTTAWKVIAEIESSRGWQPEMRAAYRKALEKAPLNAELYSMLISSATEDKEAEDVLELAMKHCPVDSILSIKAGRLFGEKKYSEAEAIYRGMAEFDPSSEPCWLDVLRCVRALGDKAGEAKVIAEAQGWVAQSPYLLEMEGRLLLEEGKREAGLEKFRESLAIRNDNPELAAYLKELEPKRRSFYEGY